jgi:hypothetical protein
MINLARIYVIFFQKFSIMLAFSMIWFKSFDFHQVHDFSIHHFDQVHDSLFQMIVFEICHTDEKFLCMSADACEIDTQMIIVWLILIKFSFIIFWFSSSSRFSSLIFIKFIIQIFKCSFLKFRIQTKNFSCMSISSYESDTAAWS